MKYQECFARSSPSIHHQNLCTLPLKLVCTDDVLEMYECKQGDAVQIYGLHEPNGVFSMKGPAMILIVTMKKAEYPLDNL